MSADGNDCENWWRQSEHGCFLGWSEDPEPVPILCEGCGATVGFDDECPQPYRCTDCPPWTCDQCGEADSMRRHCACWKPIYDIALPDLKALLAESGIGIDSETGRIST